MSYNDTSKIIADTGTNDGVSIHDGQLGLGASTNNVGGLCKFEDINEWAKYKPVIYMDDNRNPILNTLTQGEENPIGKWVWKNTSVWWKGYPRIPTSETLYNCGFLIHKFTNTADILTAFRNSSDIYRWKYLTPADGEGYRLTDFNGYKHNAAELSDKFITVKPSYSSRAADNDPVQLSITTTVSNDSSLSWADFPDLGECYLGVILWEDGSTGTSHRAVTMSEKIKKTASTNLEERISGTVQFTLLTEGTYHAIPFLSTSRQTNPSSTSGLTNIEMYSLKGNLGKQTFTVTSSDPNTWIKIADFTWNWNPGNTAIVLHVKFKTWRLDTEGNYNNNSSVAIYSAQAKLIKATGYAIPSPTSSNTTTYSFVSENSIPLAVINCTDSSKEEDGGTTHYFERDFILPKTSWDESFTEFNTVQFSCLVYGNVLNDGWAVQTNPKTDIKTKRYENGTQSDYGTDDERKRVIWIDEDGTVSGGSIDKEQGGFPTGQYDNP